MSLSVLLSCSLHLVWLPQCSCSPSWNVARSSNFGGCHAVCPPTSSFTPYLSSPPPASQIPRWLPRLQAATGQGIPLTHLVNALSNPTNLICSVTRKNHPATDARNSGSTAAISPRTKTKKASASSLRARPIQKRTACRWIP